MSILVAVLRLAGRLLLALSFELDQAWRDLTVDTACPDTIPGWVDEECDLP